MMSTQERLKEIKQKFFLQMNGVASQSMREKGLDYKINWGIELPVLKRMAAGYGRDYGLAAALWKEDIRECKILATLMMPPERMDRDLVYLWIEQTTSVEIAEMAAFNLYQYVSGVSVYSFEWIASDSHIAQICGYHVLARLLMRGYTLNERDVNELVDQAGAALAGGPLPVRRAARACLMRLVATDAESRRMTDEMPDFTEL